MTDTAEIQKTVKSAQRVIDIIEHFVLTRTPATLSALASALTLPKSSCLALLRTLEINGYIYEVTPQVGYYPTRRWLDKAQIIASSDPLVAKMRPIMAALAEETRETLIFGKRSDQRVIYIDVVEWPQTLRYTATAGQFKPLHGTASGKAILAGMKPDDRDALIKRYKFQKLTPHTIMNKAQLLAEIQTGIRRGWHVSRGENEPDTTAVAVPVVTTNDVFVLVVAGVKTRMERKIAQIGAKLRDAVQIHQVL
jgi:IclR family acetate operon transcriptional repressor